MIGWLTRVFCLALLAGSAFSQEPTDTDVASIRSLIEAQLAAFAEDDAHAAFALASEAIQGKFGDARTFLAMVRQGYPAVYRPAQVAFLETKVNGSAFIQHVRFVDAAGQAWSGLYEVIRAPDAGLRINGCALRKLEDQHT